MVRNISKSPVLRFFGTRYILIIVIALLALNGGIARTLMTEVTETTAEYQVKDDMIGTDAIDPIESAEPADDTLSIPVDEKATITTYTVKSGDTLGSIAVEHHISTNTIRWANNLGAKSTIKVGQELTILPVTGIQYSVKKGDTLSGIAQKFGADTDEILTTNDLEDAGKIKIGMELIIPDAEPIPVAPAKTPAKSSSVRSNTSTTKEPSSTTTKSTGDMATPIASAILTQGKHGTNAVDFGTPVGTAVYAAMSGKIILAKGDGAYNGGYGNYIVIEHDGGIQTLYGHLSKVSVSVGETVSKGESIGKSGNTGKSTGPHLHFEVRGSTNPFAADKVGTRY